MKSVVRASATLALACGSVTPVSAHHSASAVFDFEAPVEITGTLTEVRWINPHIQITVDPDDKESFSESWGFESQPPQWYRRVNVSRRVFEDAIGKQVTVLGFKARNGTAYGFVRRMTFPDGTVFLMVGDRGENVE
ncbi:MAG: DUF6152 family protein [Gammaproteobacteria bacterium]|jgi:hypothetical protein